MKITTKEPINMYEDDESPAARYIRAAQDRAARGGGGISEAEFNARMERMGLQEPAWTHQDHLEALRDGLVFAAGHKLFSPHPLAERKYCDPLFPLSMMRTVNEIVRLHGKNPNAIESPQKVVMAMSTGDLPSIVSQVAVVLSRTRQSRALQDLVSATYPIELPTFLPAAHVTAELADLPMPEYIQIREFRELPHAHIYSSGEPVQVASAASLLVITRQLILNDDLPRAVAGIQGWVTAATRVEWQMLGDMLTANANLSDGEPWFGTGNLLAATQLDSAGLAAARQALRDFLSESGQPADVQAATLIVNSADEQTALELVAALPANRSLAVVATAHIDANTWFLTADQQDAPTIGRCTIAGNGGSSITFENGGDRINSDGSAFRARHDVGFAALSRVGIVRADKA